MYSRKIFHVHSETKSGRCETSRRAHVRIYPLPKILLIVSCHVTRTTRIFINVPTLRRAPSRRAHILFFPSMGHEVRVWRSKIRMVRVPICWSITTLVECLDKDSSANCSEGQGKLTCHRFSYRFIFRLRGSNSCLCRTYAQRVTNKCLSFEAYTLYRLGLSMMDFRIRNCLKTHVLNFYAAFVASCMNDCIK